MKRRARIAGALVVSLAAAAPGCAGKSPWGTWGGGTDLPPPASASADNDPMSILAKYKADNHAFAKPSAQMPRPAGGSTSMAGGVTGAISSAVNKTKDALTIEPKVVRAPDPVSLANMPEELGHEVYLASARMHESQGHLDKAEEHYRKALEAAPNDLNVLVHYARMHDRAGNLDQAMELYRRAAAAHPNEAAAHNDLGLCFARQNRLNDSVASLRRAVELQPESELYRNNLATVLVEMGQYDEALSHLIAAHGPAVGHYNLAFLAYKGGKLTEATDFLRRALEIDPQLAPAQRLLASLTGRQPADANAARETNSSEAAYSPVSVDSAIAGRNWGQAASETPYTSRYRPQALPAVEEDEGETWGDAPTPESLPQLLPPVK